jgi:outer membrane protein assembly factor BamB
VYAVSRLGLVQAFNASDGALLWKYQATPLLYVLSEAEVSGGAVYVTGMDGSVTAIDAGLN